MSKSRRAKSLALLLALAFVFTSLFSGIGAVAFAADEGTRLYGGVREATAVEISKKGWTASDDVVLVNGYAYPDALAAGPLAQKLDAPILLTTDEVLPDVTKAEIDRLGAKTVYIVGGIGVVPDSVAKATGKTVERIGGDDRYETAVAVAEKLKGLGVSTDKVIIARSDDYPDALAASAVKPAMPILFAGKAKDTSLVGTTADALTDLGVKDVVIVGDTGAVSDVIKNQIDGIVANVTRLGGGTRIETAIAIANAFKPADGYKGVVLATGYNYADALAGGPYAAKNGYALLLTDKAGNLTSASVDFIKANTTIKADAIVALGGPTIVSAAAIAAAVEAATPVALQVVSVSAANAREIVVKFNTDLDEITAGNAANYGLTVNGTSTAFTVDFNEDTPNQVTLLLSDTNKLQNDKAVQLTVKKNVLQARTLKGLAEDYTKVWVFSDTVAPTITKVEKSGDDVVVTFDEYVTTAEIIKVNGVSFTPPAAASPTVKTITITNGAKDLAAGTYEVLLSGVSDISGNKSSILIGSFTVANDTTAPVVTKVEQTADNEITVTFDKATTLVGSSNFKVTKGGYELGVTVAQSTDTKAYTLTLADNGGVKVYDTGVDSTTITLSITGVKSTANNAVANPYTTVLTISKDKTAPSVVSRFSTITDIGNSTSPNEVFDICFNEEVVLKQGFALNDITLTDKDGVRQLVSAASVANDVNGDAKILRVTSAAVQTGGVINAGNYNIYLSAGVVKDNAGNGIAATNVPFVKTTAAASVTATAAATNNVITISYSSTMTNSATTAANYLLDGKALPAGTNIYFSGDKQTVVIELPSGTVKSTGGAVLTISDSVVSTSGAKLNAASKTQNITSGFVDNVKPTLVSAKKVSSTEIELTFSENINDAASFGTLPSTAVENDFVVKVNGATFAYTAASGIANDNKIVLTTTVAYNTAQTVTVSVTSTAADISVVDAAGNTLVTGTTVTATN